MRSNNAVVNLGILGVAMMAGVSCANATSENQLYVEYEQKVASCIASEKQRPSLSYSDVKALPSDVFSVAVFYVKEKRIVDCSSGKELDALAEEIALSGTLSKEQLKYRYLSIGLVDRKKAFDALPEHQRIAFLNAVKGKNLETDIVAIFDQFSE
ncbi:hypothetical protein ACFSJ3_01055 [Corallincola platygyrae]|uniref:Uncharacterized protein n=1 Tax=Corallincola platygyrae TaxID=1193278 RepID=A0ABW4XIF4_9GAMM